VGYLAPRVAEVDLRALDDAHCVAIWGRTLIQIWRGVATGEAAIEMNRIAGAMVGADPFPATSLFVVEATSPPPEDVPRKQFAKFSRDIVSRMSLAVIVAEGGGFRSAIVRAVGVTLTMLMPHKVPFKYVGDLESASQLLDPRLAPGTGGAAELLRIVEELRAKITRQAAVAAGSVDRRPARSP
jgi:hypothetical protein